MSIPGPQPLYHRIHGPENARPGAVPAVLLHGLMGFAANWGKIWPGLHVDRPVLVLDQRGHGRSPKPMTGYTPTDYAQDLAALLDQLGWKKAHVVGHSMGGRVALRFAKLFPETTASLTMEDSGAAARPDRVRWIRDLLASIPTPFPDRETAKAFFAAKFRDDPLTGGFLHANLEQREDGTLSWRFHAPGMIETVETGRATDALGEFAAIASPTLLLRGSRSVEFTDDEARTMAASRAGVELRTIEGAGHYVHAEQPKAFTEALSGFLTRVDQDP